MKPSLIRALNALGFRRAIIVILALTLAAGWLGIAVMFGVIPVGPGLTNRLGGIGAGDFMFFYPAGVLAAGGEAAGVYDPQRLTEVGRQLLGPKLPELVWPYPPTISLPLALLGKFQPGTALAIWMGTAVMSLLGLARLALGTWRLAPLVFLCPASALALFTGQFTPVLGLLLGLFFLYGSRRPAIGGLALGLLVWKPHFAVIPAVFGLLARRGKAISVAVVAGAVVISASVLTFGLDIWLTFFQQGVRHSGVLSVEAPMARFVSVFGAALTWGLSIPAALTLHVLAALVAGLVGWALFINAARQSLSALGFFGATLQISPYVLDYDLVFLVLPWLLMIRESREDSSAAVPLFWIWLALTCLVPAAYMIPLYTGRSIAGPILLLILMFAYWRSRLLGHRP